MPDTTQDARSLREIFPTTNGHRLEPCPFCRQPTPMGERGYRTCSNVTAHGPNCMFPGKSVSW